MAQVLREALLLTSPFYYGKLRKESVSVIVVKVQKCSTVKLVVV